VLLVLLAAPGEFRLPDRWLRLAGASTAAGLLASQSRGAMIAFAAGVLIWSFRRPIQPGRVYRRRAILLLFAIALVLVAALSVRHQLQAEAHGTTINSLTQRAEVAKTTRRLHRGWPQVLQDARLRRLPGAERHRRRGPCRGRRVGTNRPYRVRDRIIDRARAGARRPRNCGIVRRRGALRPRTARYLLDRRHDRASLDRGRNGARVKHRAMGITALVLDGTSSCRLKREARHVMPVVGEQ
jgi:hypothetical protein